VIGTVGSRYAREDKKKGIFGYKRFLVPVNKVSLFKFHDVECFTQDSGARRGCSGSVSSHTIMEELANIITCVTGDARKRRTIYEADQIVKS
jgi:hypothetical protein